MDKPITVIALGGGISLAALGFVGAFLWVESPPESDLIESVVTLSPDLDEAQPLPHPVSPSDLTTTESGLQYYDIEVGTGGSPVEGQIVEVHYSGWLKEGGKLFDSSVHSSRPPISFQLGRPGIIPGWQEGVASMKVGGKRQLVIPPDLAYGDKAREPIPPNSTLVFDVELVELGEVRQRPERPGVDLASDPRVQEPADGVRIIDLEQGEGVETAERSVVELEMTLWNAEGEVFYSSWDKPRPVSFLIGGTRMESPPLPGLDVGIRGMKPGGVRYMELQPAQAFGERGQPPMIAPNSVVYARVQTKAVSSPRTVPDSVPAFDRASMTTTESGLKYVDVVVGEGDSPKEGDIILADYSGWLDDGTLFDSSYQRKAPYSFPLGQSSVIPAWNEAIATMKPGGTRIIVAPPAIAYGETGRGRIPPNATLTFQIDLKDVKSQ